MPKKIRDYLFKIKSPRPQIRLPSKNWILSGCKHPRTPSFALYSVRNEPSRRPRHHHHQQQHVVRESSNNHHRKDDAATLADVDRFLLENFKSLYLKDDDETLNTKRVFEGDDGDHEAVETTSPRDVRGSTRFFVKPGFSGSLVEDALTNTTINTATSDEVGSVSTVSTLYDVSSSGSYEKEGADHALPDDSIALLTHSTSPYDDFRRSMQEMVNNHEGVVDWDFMEELLFSYLNLNHKKSHKFILGAFVDLITVMRRSNSEPPSDKPRSVRTVRSVTKNVTLGFGSSL
ncbi:transcription repressor OFP14-like [Vigna unguiculata]|uniref:Transcription repressor n=1 Tax=Vigna unguiculata TaxID=3917 RepID=A0A4D6N6P6_VIGUN|nr:transcription repressor OFP14-like [Vigna unguiculata]QCE08948.1 Ovate protein family [Vigna unguiculata]